MMPPVTRDRPIFERLQFWATHYALRALDNKIVQAAVGALVWAACIAFIFLTDAGLAASGDALNVLFGVWNVLADVTGLPRAPYLEG
ncbi:hypothetical protein K2X14_11445 [Acetobacter sp. TBRC 12305]|uniref:Uncharacterized protein n=1 Tax=Acetobacter garciniae TaxID=2817435 RepID=A0A939KRL8_9PROT|nr:hypothetical protein [Acetobacter garciniae]MBO1325376.1 hypothetical protein [Acetobacter garciniae]MBX0345452.1 hypothetical protein [Acetobacter garciniae]